MFTGIIQDVGEVESLVLDKDSLQLCIATQLEKSFLTHGASIACNGCCLTVTEATDLGSHRLFSAQVGPQTLANTNFASLKKSSLLNLEPALRAQDAFGGHYLTGHIDTTCPVEEFYETNNGFWKLSIVIPTKFLKWVLPKGSLAVAGISLTIANITDNHCVEMMIIPHTFQKTNLKYLVQKTNVEIEFDHTVKTISSVLEVMLPRYIAQKIIQD